MYLGIHYLGPQLPAAALPAPQVAKSLVIGIAMGAPVYALTVLLLWVWSARPDESAEAYLLKKLSQFWRRFRPRHAVG
jgi:ABC-type transport system involved in cytochrome c biogenesis permease subunit